MKKNKINKKQFIPPLKSQVKGAFLLKNRKKNNHNIIDLKMFCEIFPNGFPSEQDLEKIWDGQKVDREKNNQMASDNLVDYQSAMGSIQFQKV